MPRKQIESKPLADCDFCYQRRGRNAMIVHCLKMSDREYQRHLRELCGKAGIDDGWIDSRITWHRFIWKYYGEACKTNHVPIWQAYLEAQGIKVIRAAKKEEQDQVPF